MPDPVRLTFDGGSIVLQGDDPPFLESLPGCRFDSRTQTYRAEGRHYRAIVETLHAQKIAYIDQARSFEPIALQWHAARRPFPHQLEALRAWWERGRGRGVVVLPTGTGKTFLAMMAIRKVARPTLVVTPTIDLLHQWYSQLSDVFRTEIGLLGGGSHALQPLTVATYDSAYLYLERWGHRFGLLVSDECHHLPGPSYQLIAVGAIAPYRLGLTATPERADGQHILLDELLGPIIFRREIHELAGEFLAEYRTERIDVDLTPEEEREYQRNRSIYRSFVAERGIRLNGPQGWQRFIQESQRSSRGRQAFRAYLEQKRLERAPAGKLLMLEELLRRHQRDRVLIFTADNATVYRIARAFLVPAITHQTKAKERKQILQRFHSGEYSVVVTSQVLNEGVDVPAANVGIVLSGTGTTRESVQRLGRLLRKQGGKQAVLYELVARNTAEVFTSQRRRRHQAFQPEDDA